MQIEYIPDVYKRQGIDKNLFYESILDCYKIRDRYSIFKLAVDKNKIEDCAKIITEKIYG